MPLNESVSNTTVQYTVTTTRVADGTVLYWRTTGSVSNSDIVGGNTGSITIANNQATFNVTVVADTLTESNETLGISISTGSLSGPTVVSTANPITIEDTSLSPVYKLFSVGGNGSGQLGLNNTVVQSSPTQVGTGTTWLTISAGYNHSMAIKDDGTLWAWGDGYNGALGLNDSGAPKYSPTQVGALTTWLKVSTGYQFTLAIKNDGTLWSWGRNNFGQLGLGGTVAMSSPTQVGSATDWRLIAAGQNHAIGISSQYMYGWGYNFSGQVGDNSKTTRTTPTIHNTPFQQGTYDNGTGWQSISAGIQHSAGVFIGGGGTQRTLYVWGFGPQLGLNGVTVYRSTPDQVGSPGNDWYTTLATVSCGGEATAITTTDGKLWTWGSGAYGALGQNSSINRSSPVQVAGTTWLNASFHGSYSIGSMVATKTNGTLWSWGGNWTGQLGHNDTVHKSSPVQVGTATNWNKVSMGRIHFLATTNS